MEYSERSRGLTNIECTQYTHEYIYDSTRFMCVCSCACVQEILQSWGSLIKFAKIQ